MNIKSFFKLYTMPILALCVGFGLYYLIFTETHKQGQVCTSELSVCPLVMDSKGSALEIKKESSTPEENQEHSDKRTQEISPEEIMPLLEDNPQPTQEKTEIKDYIVIPKVINIRQEPNTTSKVVGKLVQNQTVGVHSIAEGWAKLEDGWVLLKLLKPIQLDLSSIQTNLAMYIVIPKVINIRQEPNTTSKVVGKLSAQDVVEVESTKDGWAKLKTGWVLLRLLKKQDGN